MHTQGVRPECVGPADYAKEGETQPELPVEGTEEVLQRKVPHAEPNTRERAVNVAHRCGKGKRRPRVHVLLAVPALPPHRTSAIVRLMVGVHAQRAEAQIGAGTLDAGDRGNGFGRAIRGGAAKNAGEHYSKRRCCCCCCSYSSSFFFSLFLGCDVVYLKKKKKTRCSFSLVMWEESE